MSASGVQRRGAPSASAAGGGACGTSTRTTTTTGGGGGGMQYRGSSVSASANSASSSSHRDGDRTSVPSGTGGTPPKKSGLSTGAMAGMPPLRRPPTKSTAGASRARRLARRKNSKPFSKSVWANFFHPDELFHLALLGMSLFTISAVVIYRATRGEGGGAYEGGDLAVDDVQGGEGEGPTLRTNMGAPNVRPNKHGGGGHRGWLGSLFGRPPAPKPCDESLDHIGDKTRTYYELRQEYEALLPEDHARTLEFVTGLRKNTYELMHGADEVGYDVHNCPLYPPANYPAQFPVLDVLKNWPTQTADPEPLPKLHQGLCVFDHATEYEKAQNYRQAEVPFVMRDDPSFLRTAERWNQPGYMARLQGPVPHRTEYSPDNHFMYWMNPKMGRKNNNKTGPNGKKRKKGPLIKEPEGWTPPTKLIRMKFDEWYDHANATDDMLGPDNPHWYYRLIGCGEMGKCDKDSSEYLFDEIPNFQPRPDNFYIVEPERQKGIHCRFGMKGVIAENHFDGSRNTIALFGGERRYILSHPNQCSNLALLPKGHPSARHSAIDWTDPDLENFPQFKDAEVNEVVMQAGDALYLPTNWFHYIVSLELNYQCNSRSGINADYMQPIHDCGF